MASTTKKNSNVKNLASQLKGVSSVAKSLGINTAKSDAMVKQTEKQGSKAYAGSSYDKGQQDVSPTSITSSSLAPVTPIVLPKPTVGTDLTSTMNGINAGLAGMSGGTTTYDSKTGQLVAVPPKEDRSTALLQQQLQSMFDLQDEAPSYEKGVKDLQKSLKPKENLVNSLTGQINTITTARDAQMLSLEGQGRGQTQSFIGGEQARISREAAITAMPLQAALSIAQDDLESARTYASQLFTAQMQDAQNAYNFKKEVNSTIFTFLNEKEKRQLAVQDKADDRAFQLTRDNTQRLENLADKAMEYGYGSRLPAIMALKGDDPLFPEKYARLAEGIQKPVSPTDTAPKVVSVNGVDSVWNPTSGQFEAITVGGNTSNALSNAIAENKVDNINNILSSNALGSVVGPSGLARTEPGLWNAAKRFFTGALSGGAVGAGAGALAGGIGAIPGAIIGAVTTGVVNSLRGSKDELTGDRQAFIGSVEQMRAELTKDKLGQAKGQGITFGALSDGEKQLIANAATKLGTWAETDTGKPDGKVIGYNVAEKDFKKEMDVINYFTKLDAVLRGATPESVGAVTNPDGTLWILNSDGTMSQLKR